MLNFIPMKVSSRPWMASIIKWCLGKLLVLSASQVVESPSALWPLWTFSPSHQPLLSQAVQLKSWEKKWQASALRNWGIIEGMSWAWFSKTPWPASTPTEELINRWSSPIYHKGNKKSSKRPKKCWNMSISPMPRQDGGYPHESLWDIKGDCHCLDEFNHFWRTDNSFRCHRSNSNHEAFKEIQEKFKRPLSLYHTTWGCLHTMWWNCRYVRRSGYGEGTPQDIFEDPKHPYTLASSVLSRPYPEADEAKTLYDSGPSELNETWWWLSFCPRCESAEDSCRKGIIPNIYVKKPWARCSERTIKRLIWSQQLKFITSL